MAAKSKNRNTEESLSRILLQIFASVTSLTFVGILLGVLYLLSVPPVEGVDAGEPTETAEDVSNKLTAALRGDFEEQSSAAYGSLLSALEKPLSFQYIPGREDGASSDRIAEFNTLIAERSGTVSLSDSDLNRIATSVLRVRDSSAAVIQEMKDSGASAYSVPTSLNFRIADGTLQIASTLKVKNPLIERDILFVTRGVFQQNASGANYRPEIVYFNSVRIPPPLDGVLANSLIRQFVSGIFSESDGPRPSAPRQVRIESDRLVIAL